MRRHDRDLVEKGYEFARKAYAAYGVDTDAVIKRLQKLQISLHCWQGVLKAILIALLEPTELLLLEEKRGNYGNRLALMEEFKALPFGAVWDKYCLEMQVPAGSDWMLDVRKYEEKVLSKR